MDQTGFVPGREGKDNGLRTILLLQRGRNSDPPRLFLSIDAEKAFDRVDWGFMIEMVIHLGLGPKMVQSVQNFMRSSLCSS